MMLKRGLDKLFPVFLVLDIVGRGLECRVHDAATRRIPERRPPTVPFHPRCSSDIISIARMDNRSVQFSAQTV